MVLTDKFYIPRLLSGTIDGEYMVNACAGDIALFIFEIIKRPNGFTGVAYIRPVLENCAAELAAPT